MVACPKAKAVHTRWHDLRGIMMRGLLIVGLEDEMRLLSGVVLDSVLKGGCGHLAVKGLDQHLKVQLEHFQVQRLLRGHLARLLLVLNAH